MADIDYFHREPRDVALYEPPYEVMQFVHRASPGREALGRPLGHIVELFLTDSIEKTGITGVNLPAITTPWGYFVPVMPSWGEVRGVISYLQERGFRGRYDPSAPWTGNDRMAAGLLLRMRQEFFSDMKGGYSLGSCRVNAFYYPPLQQSRHWLSGGSTSYRQEQILDPVSERTVLVHDFVLGGGGSGILDAPSRVVHVVEPVLGGKKERDNAVLYKSLLNAVGGRQDSPPEVMIESHERRALSVFRRGRT